MNKVPDQILFGQVADLLPDVLNSLAKSKIVILCDENTEFNCLPAIKDLLGDQTYFLVTVAAGENSKNLEHAQRIWALMLKEEMGRDALVLNLGGGMITDLGGFVAACYQRGIDYINIPTSLLAMTDAALGGKTGVDLAEFKNMVGSFHNAQHIIIDPTFLLSLQPEQLRSGLAEVIKHGIISDAKIIEALEANNFKISDEIIRMSVAVKTAIVAKDEREGGLRKLLNFGHSIGHAIESSYLADKDELLHGFAIAAGMIAESHIAHQRGMLSKKDFDRIIQMLESKFDLPVLKEEDLMKYIKVDKKNTNSELNFSLPTGIGTAEFDVPVTEEEIKSSLAFYSSILK